MTSDESMNRKAMPTNSKAEPSADVPSPCVYICALDDQDVCIGCYRSAAEITGWSRYSNEEKQAVLKKVGERERASGNFIAS